MFDLRLRALLGCQTQPVTTFSLPGRLNSLLLMIEILHYLKDLRTLNYGNYGILRIINMGNAGCISSTVLVVWACTLKHVQALGFVFRV